MVSLTIATKEGGDFLVPQGTHTGIIVQMIHLGMQSHPQFGDSNKMMVVFETPDELVETGEQAGKPKQISQYVNLSLGAAKKPSTLREVIQAVEGKELSNEEAAKYDIFKMLGKSVQLNVTHTVKGDKTNHRITQHGISALHKSIKRMAPVAELLALYLPEFDNSVFMKLPEWMRKQVKMDEVPVELRPAQEF